MEFITEEVRLTIKIILIDMILSADKAIVIGLAAAQFDPKIRKKVVLSGTALAVIFRLFFALSVAYFLQFKGVRTFGGILLFYIAYKIKSTATQRIDNIPSHATHLLFLKYKEIALAKLIIKITERIRPKTSKV